MAPITVIILHAEAGPLAGPLERLLIAARAASARSLAAAFGRLGVEARIVAGTPDGLRFGRRLAGLIPPTGGLVVIGSGSVPLAEDRDLARFVAAAAARERIALANNRFSADAIAISRAGELPPLPDLPGDNALPRWLAEVAGWRVIDLRARWRLQVDIDSPLDVLLVGALVAAGGGGPHRGATGPAPAGAAIDPHGRVAERLAGVRAVLADRRAELVLAGRTSAASLRWLERHAASRIRALVEERGLRAATSLALGPESGDPAPGDPPSVPRGRRRARPPRSILGRVLEAEGPGALGRILSDLGDAALVDTRVLLAHRLGADEAAWPAAEDRFASDVLSPGSIADPWLRDLTAAALEAPIPVLLGGHSLVGPGVRLVLPGERRAGRPRGAGAPPDPDATSAAAR